MSARLGRYEIIAPLGTGGMAEILLAKLSGPEGFQRPVVIKRIRDHLLQDRAFVDMFLDEARLIASIRHPNVVQVQELGNADGQLFLAMEYLHGDTVLGFVRRLASLGRGVPNVLASYIISEAAAGLHAAHELADSTGKRRGVVHRDLSPDNLFITYDGDVKVIDFGIAKATQRKTKTLLGMVKGKVSYMSPEQLRGKAIDHRSDIFGLGIVLWELLAGRRLFKRAREEDTISAVLAADVPAIPSCSDDLFAVCKRALARDPDKRYQTAGELRRDLAAIFLRAGLTELPQDTLASLMQHSFAEEITERSALLSQASVDAHVREVASLPDLESLPEVAEVPEGAERSDPDPPDLETTQRDGGDDATPAARPAADPQKTTLDQLAPDMSAIFSDEATHTDGPDDPEGPQPLPPPPTLPPGPMPAAVKEAAARSAIGDKPTAKPAEKPAEKPSPKPVKAISVAAPNRRTAKRQRLNEETEVVGRPVVGARRSGLIGLVGWIAVLAIAAGSVGVFVWVVRRKEVGTAVDPAPVTPPTPVVAATAPPEAPAVPTSKTGHVSLHLSSTPEGADVTVAGVERGRTPIEIDLPRGDQPIDVTLTMPNYRPRNARIVPDRDRDLELPLLIAPAPAEEPRPAPKPPGKKKSGPFFKFD